MKHNLLNKGCTFHKHSLWEINKKELNAIHSRFAKEGGLKGIVDVIQRKMIDGDGKKRNCVDTRFLTSHQMMEFPISGCKAPDEYDSPYSFTESEDKQIWGYGQKLITQETQTKPNPITGKVDKWTGDWRTLQIDYHREKKLRMRKVFVPKR